MMVVKIILIGLICIYISLMVAYFIHLIVNTIQIHLTIKGIRKNVRKLAMLNKETGAIKDMDGLEVFIKESIAAMMRGSRG